MSTSFARKRKDEFFDPKLSRSVVKAGLKAASASPENFKAWAETMGPAINRGLEEISSTRSIFTVTDFAIGEQVAFPVFQRNELTSGVWTVPDLFQQPTQMPVTDIVYPSTFSITTSLEWPKRLQDEGRIDVVNQCMRVLTDAMVAAEEAAGWALLITAATSANDAVTLAEADPGSKYLSKNLLKVLMKRMVKHPTKPRQQMGKALTNLWASPDRLFDTLDWEGTFFGEATKDQIVRQGVLNAVVGVAFDPYYGLDSQTVYGFDLNGRDAFRLGLYGPLESEELFEARDKWRVGVKMKQDESLLCTDSRNIIKGIIRAE
jgi:hypothetical protein